MNKKYGDDNDDEDDDEDDGDDNTENENGDDNEDDKDDEYERGDDKERSKREVSVNNCIAIFFNLCPIVCTIDKPIFSFILL